MALRLISQSQELNIANVVIQIFGTLLCQGISFPVRSPRVAIIICVWVLVLCVISNGYSSILSVQIVKPILPKNYPSDLESVSHSNLRKFTYMVGLNGREINLESDLQFNNVSWLNNSKVEETNAYIGKITSQLESITSKEFFEESLSKRTFALVVPQDDDKYYNVLFKAIGKYIPVEKVFIQLYLPKPIIFTGTLLTLY